MLDLRLAEHYASEVPGQNQVRKSLQVEKATKTKLPGGQTVADDPLR